MAARLLSAIPWIADGHRHEGCRFAMVRKTWADYRPPKLARNRERDTENDFPFGISSGFMDPT